MAGRFSESAPPEEATEGSGVRSRRSLTSATELAANRNASAEVFGMTDRGCVRPTNQDQFLVAELERVLHLQQTSMPRENGSDLTDNPQGRLLMVADGMGGHEGGEVASALAIETLARYAFAVMPWLLSATKASQRELENGLRQAMHDTHEKVRRVASEPGRDERMGTTLTMAYVSWPELYVLHAGDSRCYLMRRDKLHRITQDHTFAQQLVERQAMTEEEAAHSRFRHVLVNAVGGGSPKIKAELHHLTLEDGDHLLLCSDGLTGHIGDAELQSMLQRTDPVERIVRDLIDRAKLAGGHDNITAIVARF